MSSTIPVGIAGLGHYVPEQTLDNDWFAQHIETSNEWIQQRTGIIERRWLPEGKTTSDIFIEAGRLAMERAGVLPEEIDLIVVGTISGDYLAMPATACIVQDKADIEKPVLELWVTGLGLGNDIYTIESGQFAQCIGFRSRDIYCTGVCKIRMISIHDLVVKPLQGAFRYGDQAHREIDV